MKLGVLILAHGQKEMTVACLESIYGIEQRGGRGPDVVLLVDNGSFTFESDADRPYIMILPWNLPFALATSIGIESMFSQFPDIDAVIVMNNDTKVITEDWLANFERHLNTFDIVGLGHTHADFAEDAVTLSILRVEERYRRTPLEKYSYVGFWCVAICRDAWVGVGPLDHKTFDRIYFEDRDWCYRAQDAHFKIAQAHDIMVEHKNNATMKALGEDTSAIGQVYHDRFVEKWGFLENKAE